MGLNLQSSQPLVPCTGSITRGFNIAMLNNSDEVYSKRSKILKLLNSQISLKELIVYLFRIVNLSYFSKCLDYTPSDSRTQSSLRRNNQHIRFLIIITTIRLIEVFYESN